MASVVAAQKQLTSLKERRSLTDLRVTCVIAGEGGRGNPTVGHVVTYQFIGTSHMSKQWY